MQKRYKQLARRMVLTSLVLALLPLYVLGAAIAVYFTSMHEQNQRAELRNIAVNRADAVQLFLAERTAMLEALVHTAPLDRLTRAGELQSVLRLLNRRQSSFLDLGVIGADGSHVDYVGPHPLQDRKYGETPWFAETMLRGVYVSDVFLGFRGVPHFVVAVQNDDGDEPWILRATIDSEVFTHLVRSAQLGVSGDAYLVNRAGQLQTPPRFGGEILGRAWFDVSSAAPGVSVVKRARPNGQEVITAFVWLVDKDWLLVIDRDPQEPLGPLHLARRLEILTLGIGTLLIVAAVVILVRLFVQRLEAQDRRRAAIEAQLAHSARLMAVGRMAAGVAHEVNNPLAAIGELAGLMEDLLDEEIVGSMPHGELFGENVRKIQEHVDRARDVTHRLVGFARRMEPRKDLVDVNCVVDETLSFVEREAVLKGLHVTRTMAADLPMIRTDQAQLQQVVLNVLNNAIDAVAEGGFMVVETRIRHGMCEVVVADDGPGISADIKDSIFDPFFTTKEPGEGTGLGLSISHSIMQQLGGVIEFESEPDRGTTFHIRLPLITI